MFAFSTLFSAVGVAAAFDTAIATDAAQGRVNRPFAMLAAAEYGLPMLKADGNPIAKPQFLKLAQSYRDAKGKGHGIKGHKQLALWGAAFDAIALGLLLGNDATEERMQALRDAGQYLGDLDAWQAATKPVAKPKTQPAPKVGEPSPVATDQHAPIVRAQQAPGAVVTTAGAASGLDVLLGTADAPSAAPASESPELVTIDLDTAVEAVMLAAQTGALTRAQLVAVALACEDALRAMPADVIPVGEATEVA